MSKKLKDLKHKTRNAVRGGRNGKVFEKFVNEFNARAAQAAGIQSPSRAKAASGRHFAEGFSETIHETTG